MLSGVRERWRNEKAGEGFLNPLYFSVGVRWLAWLAGLAIVLLGSAPEDSLMLSKILLVVTAVQLSLMTLYLPVVRPRYLGFLEGSGLLGWFEDNPFLPAADMLASLAAVAVTGGWESPFYQFALTSVIAPSLKYGLTGATLASFGFVGLYFSAVVSLDPQAVVTPGGSLDQGLVTVALNPIMIAYFCAFLAEVLNRLREEKEKARRLAAREERSRLAREIHDGVAQTLFMLALSLESCVTLAGRAGNQDLGERLKGLVGVSRQALLEIRGAMFDLGPLLEGEQPLRGALEGLLREFRAVSRTDLTLTVEGEEPELPVPVRIALYRILQEALANACKHSQACSVDLRLEFTPSAVIASVRDDGVGFDATGVERGHGLSNMQTRAREAGGELRLVSEASQGTTLQLSIPLGDS